MAVVAPDSVHRKLVMAMIADPLTLRPAQHFHHVAQTKALADPINARQRLLRILQAIITLGRIKADIAVTARLLAALAKIVQQHQTATGLRLGKCAHGIELVGFHIPHRPGLFFFQHPAQPHHIRRVEEQYCFGRQTITASTARFLIVGLDVARNIKVHHKSHVRLVDPHAERHCGDHYL